MLIFFHHKLCNPKVNLFLQGIVQLGNKIIRIKMQKLHKLVMKLQQQKPIDRQHMKS